MHLDRGVVKSDSFNQLGRILFYLFIYLCFTRRNTFCFTLVSHCLSHFWREIPGTKIRVRRNSLYVIIWCGWTMWSVDISGGDMMSQRHRHSSPTVYFVVVDSSLTFSCPGKLFPFNHQPISWPWRMLMVVCMVEYCHWFPVPRRRAKIVKSPHNQIKDPLFTRSIIHPETRRVFSPLTNDRPSSSALWNTTAGGDAVAVASGRHLYPSIIFYTQHYVHSNMHGFRGRMK